ncbi:hypothetical protein ACLB2K_070706 [Fragaria x ananassa]
MGVENYHVIELVGEGSFGKVYKGRRKFTGQTVAMKFVMKHGKSDKDIHNLRQEIESSLTTYHAVGKVTSTASSEDNSGIFDAQSNIPDSKAVVGCSEDASGRVMLESIACITAMLTRVNEGLKELFSTPALQEVSGPNEAVKQILNHAKTSGLADQLCLCLATAGESLISGSSNMLRSACEACRAIWLPSILAFINVLRLHSAGIQVFPYPNCLRVDNGFESTNYC